MYNCLNYGCDTLGTQQLNDCEEPLLGGMSAMLVLACNHQITDPSNATQVNAAIANGTATLISGVSLSLEIPTAIKTPSLVACQTDIITNYTRTALYRNQNVNATNIDFHIPIFSGRAFGGLIFYECSPDGAGANNVLWIDAAVKGEGGLTVPLSNQEIQRFEGTFSWLSKADPAMYTAPAGVFA